MNSERIEVYIYVNKINKTTKASIGIYLKYFDKNNKFIMDKRVSSNIIQYKKFDEEVIYRSLIDACNLIKNKDILTLFYCSYDGSYKRTKELDKVIKKFYRVNFIFNYEDETARLISKEGLKEE